ncbi:PEP-CTERM sorting domain-containing protein [Massilia antarctica]|uniref:PEP-CTERM sorting domain-containing protein n=1 Tax=Massilia antarctica TaxID=2765360 RepID=A0AA48WDZ5_9BURK|nr:PEP-CTERM sorting domain-containing protein [Massilia antarctica]QPI50756.1 PEP-CTERM sorting domain-containing protein [Massilia antarctica]
MNSITRRCVALALLGMAGIASNAALAGPLPTYSSTYPTPNSACATYGNFVSCSTGVLNYLSGSGATGFTGDYTFSAAQGTLHDAIVVASNGGAILANGDVALPSENGFKTINGGQKDYFFTGDRNDPINNGALANDTAFSWDMGLGTLNSKLTFDGDYHQMMIAFDFNNPQNATASLPIWALVTIRDSEGNLANKYFETQQLDLTDIFKDPSLFQSTKTFDGTSVTTPASGDFAMTVGAICVVSSATSYPSPDGSHCPTGGHLVNTNQASNAVEFINYIPSLDLKGLQGAGYDSMSVQVWMGCFGTGGTTSGPTLADGKPVGPCDTGGYGDIFLIAGAAVPGRNDVPEPGTLALVTLSLFGLHAARRRRQTP